MRLTLESELREYGQDRLHLITGDTSRENDILGVYEWAEDHWGPVNLLIANAAIAPRQSLLTLSLEEWDQVQRTNVTGPFLLSRELFRRLPEQQIADIVNVASLGGIRGTEKFPGLTAYSVSKFALVGLTECLAAEGRARGIRVNAVAPGAVNTQMLREAAPHLSTRTEPLDIAKVIVYLADREASGALNGSVLEIYSNENGEN
jgi:NAD(P)-dependent dehydrogenase (short-subunit alcohol dehydrogenase family)